MDNIKPFYYLSKTFGISPFSLKKTPQYRSSVDIMHSLPTFIAIAVYTICLSSIFYQSSNQSDISLAANWIQFIPNAVAYLASLLFAYKKRKIIQTIIIQITNCDEKIKDYFSVSFTTINKHIKFRSLLASLISIACGCVFGSINFYIRVDWNDLTTFLYWLAFFLPKLTLLLVNFQFGGLIKFLIDRVELLHTAINFQLSESKYQIKTLTESSNNNLIINNNNDIINSNNNTNKDSMKPKNILTNLKMRLPSPNESLQAFTEIIELLQEIAMNINLYFGKQMVLILLSAFICVTVQLYHVINHIRYSFEAVDSELIAMSNINLILIHTIEFWAVYNAGSLIKQKWTNIINLLHNFKLKTIDESLRNKIINIITWMTSKRIEFDAVGYFPIDLSIATGIASSIATYLIVLVQFQISEDQIRGKNATMNTIVYSSKGRL